VTNYFARVQPQLVRTDRSREILRLLAEIRLPVPLSGVSRDVFLNAANALLPEWASERLGHTPWRRRQARIAARVLQALAPGFRAALHDGVVDRACRRVGVPPTAMRRWPGER
jgi:uncharacterized protein (DUF2236 family)